MTKLSLVNQYKQYEKTMDEISNSFCLSFFPDGVPQKIYDIGVNHRKYKFGYYIRSADVELIKYHFKGDMNKPYYNKRPTKEQINQIKAISEALLIGDLKEENVCLHVKNERTSWGIHLKDINEGKVSTKREDMAVVLLEKIEHYKKHYLVGENQFPCAYCRKATDVSKKVTKNVISRQYQNFRHTFDYCSETCASHDQMAHEG